MSYCRWSTDDFRCDLYLYADVRGGFTLHVAANRWDYPIPEKWAGNNAPPMSDPAWADWYTRRDAAMKPVRDATPRVPIDLPHAGETFRLESPGEVIERLRELRAIGYRFPDSVIEELEAEQATTPAPPGPTTEEET